MSDLLCLTSFTASPPFPLLQMFLALSTASQLLMVPDTVKASLSALSEVLFRRQYTSVLQLTPTLFYRFGEGVIRKVLGADTRVRVLAFGGEVCPSVEKLSEWKSPKVEYFIAKSKSALRNDRPVHSRSFSCSPPPPPPYSLPPQPARTLQRSIISTASPKCPVGLRVTISPSHPQPRPPHVSSPEALTTPTRGEGSHWENHSGGRGWK